MEATELDSSFADTSFLEVAEKGVYYFTALTALSIAIPAALKKRRVYTLVAPVALPEAIIEPERSEEARLILPPDLSLAIPPPRAANEVPLCTAYETGLIEELFTTIANHNSLQLFWKQTHLNDLGERIRNVHPFSLLLAMPKEAMRTILTKCNPITLSRVLGGIAKGMEENRATLPLYLDSFARKLNKNPQTIQDHLRHSRWEKLLNDLFC